MSKAVFLLVSFLFLTVATAMIGNQCTLVNAGMYGLQPPPAPNAIVISPNILENYFGTVPLIVSIPMNGSFHLPTQYQGSGNGFWGIESLMYSLDGSENVTTATNTTLNQLPDGQHQLTLYANRWVYYGIYYGGEEDTVYLATVDFLSANNIPSTTPVNVTAIPTPPTDRNPPHLQLVDYIPAVLITLAVVLIILFMILKRRKT
jgi:hypothetical protein